MPRASRPRPVVWSADAEEDLFQIWSYVAREASRAIADSQARAIKSACGRLRRLPFSGRPRDDLVPGVRSILTGRYIVFYRVADKAVEIIRVFHGSRDLEAAFAAKPKP